MKKDALIFWHFPVLGFINAFITFLLGLAFIALVVSIPLGKGLVQYSKYLFNPVKYQMVDVPADQIDHNQNWQAFGMFVYVFYFPFSLVLAFLTFAQLVLLGLTFNGLPLAKIMIKQLKTCFNPVDKMAILKQAPPETGS